MKYFFTTLLLLLCFNYLLGQQEPYSDIWRQPKNLTDSQGKKQGLWLILIDGHAYNIDTYVDDNRTGLSLAFYPDSIVSAALYYKNDTLNGPYKSYYKSGEILTEVTFKDGKRDGIETEYYESGVIASEKFYNEGELDSFYRVYNIKGKLIYSKIGDKSDLSSIMYRTSGEMFVLTDSGLNFSKQFNTDTSYNYPNYKSFIMTVKNNHNNQVTKLFYSTYPEFRLTRQIEYDSLGKLISDVKFRKRKKRH